LRLETCVNRLCFSFYHITPSYHLRRSDFLPATNAEASNEVRAHEDLSNNKVECMSVCLFVTDKL